MLRPLGIEEMRINVWNIYRQTQIPSYAILAFRDKYFRVQKRRLSLLSFSQQYAVHYE